jgi:anti-sigma factor RsiW
MKCERAQALLPLLADAGPWRRRRLRAHLRTCAGCAAKQEELHAMSDALRHHLTYHAAPPDLAARISASLAREPRLIPRRQRLAWAWPGITGGGLAGAIAGVALMLLVQGPGGGQRSVLSAVIDSQVRSIMADHLTDVLTSDHHTVKPWLSARVDVSPPVRDLAAEGFPLIGGRLDYIDGHRAAVVVYRRDKHVINLFAWAAPGQPDAPLRTEARQGFNVVTWQAGGITYFAVSDVEADQLMAFARDVARG